MGQLAFDLRRNHREAARWFRIYLAEAANGSLAREAMGRLLEALQRSGQPAAACGIARQYLRRFPGGPHARRARRSCEEKRGRR
jgi:TolA-binding protein